MPRVAAFQGRALRAIREGRWVALDTETTGLGPRDEIVEIAVVDPGGRVLVESRVRPLRARGGEAIHGLTEQHLQTAPPWPRVWPRVERAILGCTVVACGAAFDLRMIRQSCDVHGMPWSLRSPILELSRLLPPGSPRALDSLCRAMGLDVGPRHRAAADAEAVRRVVVQVIDRDAASSWG